MPVSRIVRVEVSRRGPQGAINPADQARIDAAAEIAETITAVVQTATDAQAGAVAAAGQSEAAAAAAVQAASTAATQAAAQAAPAAAAAVQAAVAADADRAAAAAAALPSEVAERRSMIRPNSVPGYAAVVMDVGGNATWLAARDSDGGPPDWVVDHLAGRLEAPLGLVETAEGLATEVQTRESIARIGAAPGLATAVIDSNERLTWIAASSADGGMPGWVAAHVAARVSPHLTLTDTSLAPGDRWINSAGEIVPALTDMSRLATWGSSSMEGMGAEIAAEMGVLGVTVYNGGDAGVRAEHTCAQLGSHPALLTVAGGQIPASGGVTVTASNMRATSLLQPFSGTFAGVAGTLTSTSDTITFTRANTGAVVPVPVETPFIPTVGPQYRSAVAVLNLGKNDFDSDGSEIYVPRYIDEAFAWLSPLVKRSIVMGHFINRDDDMSGIRVQRTLAVNGHCRAKYGPLYFDLQAYVTGPQVWIDAGITPTAADLEHQARGNKPPALSQDSLHLNNIGDAAVAKALRRFVVALGWYKEPIA